MRATSSPARPIGPGVAACTTRAPMPSTASRTSSRDGTDSRHPGSAYAGTGRDTAGVIRRTPGADLRGSPPVMTMTGTSGRDADHAASRRMVPAAPLSWSKVSVNTAAFTGTSCRLTPGAPKKSRSNATACSRSSRIQRAARQYGAATAPAAISASSRRPREPSVNPDGSSAAERASPWIQPVTSRRRSRERSGLSCARPVRRNSRRMRRSPRARRMRSSANGDPPPALADAGASASGW